MGKRFKGKTCVYCAGEGASASADHVFAREFFPVEKRGHLPIVPACNPCNKAKSDLEHYLTAVLPFAGRHVDSTTLLVNDVPRRLEKNQKLYRTLVAGVTKAGKLGGGEQDDMAVPFDSDKLVSLFAYIARGLVAHHWNVIIPAKYHVEAVLLNPFFEPDYRRLFALNARDRVQGSVGGGAFLYEAAQAVDDPALTMWRFQVFGGIVMAGGEDLPEPASPTIWVTTSRLDFSATR